MSGSRGAHVGVLPFAQQPTGTKPQAVGEPSHVRAHGASASYSQKKKNLRRRSMQVLTISCAVLISSSWFQLSTCNTCVDLSCT